MIKLIKFNKHDSNNLLVINQVDINSSPKNLSDAYWIYKPCVGPSPAWDLRKSPRTAMLCAHAQPLA